MEKFIFVREARVNIRGVKGPSGTHAALQGVPGVPPAIKGVLIAPENISYLFFYAATVSDPCEAFGTSCNEIRGPRGKLYIQCTV